jgi:hypothetical protein
MLNRLGMAAYFCPPHPLQVDVCETVGAGQEAGSFGRGMLPQKNHHGDCRKDRQQSD